MPGQPANLNLMKTIRTHFLPRFWWLTPWTTARYLYTAVVALKEYSDDIDRAFDFQARVIDDQALEIQLLRLKVRDLDDSITRGAIICDAQTYD